MRSLVDKVIELGFINRVLKDTDLAVLLNKKTAPARYGLVNKALKTDGLIKLRRGLYVLSEKYRTQKFSQFFLASQIAPHSYISLESSLTYHGWIPEQVKTIASIVAFGRTKKFINSFGEFIFYHLPINEYEFLTEVMRIEETKEQPFLMASPLRALADLVYIKKVSWTGLNYLTESLRIEKEYLKKINPNDILRIKMIYRSKRVLYFFDKFKEELEKNVN